jgi:hypothetical protein
MIKLFNMHGIFLCLTEHIFFVFLIGEANGTLKDAVFQASTLVRHATQLLSMNKSMKRKLDAFTLAFTNGGPDHNIFFFNVMISWLGYFILGKSNFLVVARTTPAQSWTNHAERLMSVLNLTISSCALSQEFMSDEFEKNMKKCGNMSGVRRLADKLDAEVERTTVSPIDNTLVELPLPSIEQLATEASTSTDVVDSTEAEDAIAIDAERDVICGEVSEVGEAILSAHNEAHIATIGLFDGVADQHTINEEDVQADKHNDGFSFWSDEDEESSTPRDTVNTEEMHDAEEELHEKITMPSFKAECIKSIQPVVMAKVTSMFARSEWSGQRPLRHILLHPIATSESSLRYCGRCVPQLKIISRSTLQISRSIRTSKRFWTTIQEGAPTSNNF